MNINISYEIERLLVYGIKKGLIEVEDKVYVRNRIMQILNLNDIEEVEEINENLETPISCLENILDYAFNERLLESNSVESRDLLDTKIMG